MKRFIQFISIILTLQIFVTGDVTAQAVEKDFKPSVKTFYWLQSGYLNDGSDGSNPTFQFKRARFGIKGKVIENVGYHLMVEGIHNGIEPLLYQAWIDYHYSPLLNFRIGQFKYPFGLEAKPGFVYWKFIDPSFVTGGVVKNMGRLSTGAYDGLFRDIGAMISGKYKLNDEVTANYGAMIFNGNGILKTDDNDHKDFVIKGAVNAPHGIYAGLAYYMGQYYSFMDDANYGENALGLELKVDQAIEDREIQVQGEYIIASYETSSEDSEPAGYYLHGTFFLVPQILEIGVRYSFYETNRNAANPLERVKTTFGLTYYFGKNQLIRANYDVIDDDVSDSDDLLNILFQIAL